MAPDIEQLFPVLNLPAGIGTKISENIYKMLETWALSNKVQFDTTTSNLNITFYL